MIHISWIRLCGALCLSFMAADAVQSGAGEELRLKHTPGATAKYLREQKTEQVLTLNGMDIDTKSSTFAGITYTAGDKADDGSLAVTERYDVLQSELSVVGMTFQFDSANPDKEAPAGFEPVANIMRATFRTPVTTVYAADGKVLEVKFPPETLANLDPLFASLFDAEKRKVAASQQLGLLPRKAVDLGDKWDQTVEAELGGGQTLTFNLEYAYAGPVEEDGRKLHRVTVHHKTVSYSMDPTSPSALKVSQSDLKVNGSEGEFLLDAERGIIVRESSKVVIGGTMTFLAGTQELPGKLDLTLSSKLTLQP